MSITPPGLMQDEASAGYDAYSILKTGRDHHGAFLPLTFQTFNDWIAHTFVYILVPFVKLMDLSVFTVRFPVALLSIVTIPLIYFLSLEFSGSYLISLITSLLYSLSFFSVTSSRWAIPPNIVPFFTAAILLFFFKGINNTRRRVLYLAITGVISGLAVYSYPSIEGMLPVWLFVSSLAMAVSKPVNESSPIRPLFIMFIIFIILSLPLLFEHIKYPQSVTARYSMISVTALTGNPLATYLANYFSYYLPAPLFVLGDVNPTRTVPGFGYENILVGLFFYIGLVLIFFLPGRIIRILPRINMTEINSIRFFVLLFPLVPAMTLPAGDHQRATHFLPVMVLVSGLGFYIFMVKFKNILRQKLYFCIPIMLLAVLYIFTNIDFYANYFGPKYRGLNEWYFQNGLDKAIGYAADNIGKYQNIVIDSTINQPYIYVLFYTKFNPGKLTGDDFRGFADVDRETNWLAVKKFRNFRFEKVSESDISGVVFLKKIYNSPYSQYGIYEKDNQLIVKFEVKR